VADYCRQCSIEILGEDYGDLKDLTSELGTANGLFLVVICEGCGVIQVNHKGTCMSTGCLKNHNKL